MFVEIKKCSYAQGVARSSDTRIRRSNELLSDLSLAEHLLPEVGVNITGGEDPNFLSIMQPVDNMKNKKLNVWHETSSDNS